MKISVITVCFNSAKTIGSTLESVRMQSHGDIEHIVVDGGSSDGTLEIVSQTGGHVARLISESDNGIYDAMNKGLAIATGEVVGFLNSDDVFNGEDVLSKISHALSNPAIDACYGDLVYVAENDLNRVVRYWKSREYKTGLCAKGWMPAHPTFYARKAVYQRHGVFDISLKLQADFEMALRLLEIARIRTVYIPEILVRMRAGGVSNASLLNIVKGNIEASSACRKHGLSGGLIFVAWKICSRLPQLFCRPPSQISPAKPAA